MTAEAAGIGGQITRIVALNDSYTAQLLAGIAFREWLGNLPTIPAVPVARAVDHPGASAVTGGGGLSQSQLDALAQCESGGVNAWRTGWFGIEAGYPIGGLSYEEQAAWAQRIYAAHGASAWGCPV